MIAVALDCLPCHVQLLNLPRLFQPEHNRLPIDPTTVRYLFDAQHDHHLLAFSSTQDVAAWMRRYGDGFALGGRWCIPWYPYGRRALPTMHTLATVDLDCISLYRMEEQQWYHTTHERTILLWFHEWMRPDRPELADQLDVQIDTMTPIDNGMRLRIQLRTAAGTRDRDYMMRNWVLPAKQQTTRRDPRVSITTAWFAPNHVAQLTEQVQEIAVPIQWISVAAPIPIPDKPRTAALHISDILLCNV